MKSRFFGGESCRLCDQVFEAEHGVWGSLCPVPMETQARIRCSQMWEDRQDRKTGEAEKNARKRRSEEGPFGETGRKALVIATI